jgi:hypothetical protein
MQRPRQKGGFRVRGSGFRLSAEVAAEFWGSDLRTDFFPSPATVAAAIIGASHSVASISPRNTPAIGRTAPSAAIRSRPKCTCITARTNTTSRNCPIRRSTNPRMCRVRQGDCIGLRRALHAGRSVLVRPLYRQADARGAVARSAVDAVPGFAVLRRCARLRTKQPSSPLPFSVRTPHSALSLSSRGPLFPLTAGSI